MVLLFSRSVPQLSMIFNQTIDLMDSSHNHRLSNVNKGWLSACCLKAFADSVHRKGAALDNVWGFIDGTVRPCCRPKVNQQILHNGHKRLHILKYQPVTTPSGMIANFFGPVEDKRHDCVILGMSGLLQTLQRYSHCSNGEVLLIFGDPAYPLRRNLLPPYNGTQLTQEQVDFNSSMSKVRVTIEWMFGEIIRFQEKLENWSFLC